MPVLPDREEEVNPSTGCMKGRTANLRLDYTDRVGIPTEERGRNTHQTVCLDRRSKMLGGLFLFARGRATFFKFFRKRGRTTQDIKHGSREREDSTD